MRHWKVDLTVFANEGQHEITFTTDFPKASDGYEWEAETADEAVNVALEFAKENELRVKSVESVTLAPYDLLY